MIGIKTTGTTTVTTGTTTVTIGTEMTAGNPIIRIPTKTMMTCRHPSKQPFLAFSRRFKIVTLFFACSRLIYFLHEQNHFFRNVLILDGIIYKGGLFSHLHVSTRFHPNSISCHRHFIAKTHRTSRIILVRGLSLTRYAPRVGLFRLRLNTPSYARLRASRIRLAIRRYPCGILGVNFNILQTTIRFIWDIP